MSANAMPPTSRLMVLMFTDVVGSVRLKSVLGAAAYADLIARHDALFRAIIDATPEASLHKDTGDGFLATFATASHAVGAALRFQHALRGLHGGDGTAGLKVRIGIHAGEVTQLPSGDSIKIIGLAADLAARLMSLAQPGQILLSRAPFDDARQYLPHHPAVEDERSNAAPSLEWMAHGAYLCHGSDEAIEVFEVGAAGLAPLCAPDDCEKARRAVPAHEEETLGWRPAAGLGIPTMESWIIEQRLGEGSFGEVWLARHAKTRLPRVFKFCFDADRLRSFKRELTLFRLLRHALGDRSDIVRLGEIQLDRSPYFLESEYAPLGNLATWAEAKGGLSGVPLALRLDIVARIADAVAAAHSIGILHKDIKPSNVLMYEETDGAVRPRLADFGIGALTDLTQLEQRDITITGLTEVDALGNTSSRAGTRIYMPPEALCGQNVTTQGDVYALGVMLYQMVIGDLQRPLASGWERNVSDPLLREDIAACVDEDLARRLTDAAEIARRLRALPERRAEAEEDVRAAEAETRRRRSARTAKIVSIVLIVLLGFAVFAFFRERTLRQRAFDATESAQNAEFAAIVAGEAAKKEARKGQAINAFFQRAFTTPHLSTPASQAADASGSSPQDITLKQALDHAASFIDETFGNDPEAEAVVRDTIGTAYLRLGHLGEAELHLARALELYEKTVDARDQLALLCLVRYVSVLQKISSPDHAHEIAMLTVRRTLDALGEDSEITQTAITLSLQTLRAMGFSEQNFQTLTTALDRRRTRLGNDNLHTLITIEILADYCLHDDRHERARELYEELGRAHELDPSFAPQSITALQSLARMAFARRQFAEAAAFEQRAFDLRAGTSNPEDEDSLIMLTNLAHYEQLAGHLDSAESRLRQVLSICRNRGTPANSTMMTAMNNLARLLTQTPQPRWDESESLFRELLAIAEQHVQNLATIATVRMNYGEMLLRASRPREAQPHLETALLELEESLGPDHNLTRQCRTYLAETAAQ